MAMVLSILVGLGLAAACGFRVFVPLLIASIAIKAGAMGTTPAFAWLGSDEALIAFAFATLLEVLGYFVPWVDHMLDVISTPAAIVAGTLLAASQFVPTGSASGQMLGWGMAVIAGGGIAGGVQAVTVATRAASTAITGGLANPLVATVEVAAAASISVLSIFVPLGVFVLVCALAYLAIRWWQRRAEARQLAVA